MERLRRQLAANPRNHPGIAINVSDLATLLAIIGASAKALGPFANSCPADDHLPATMLLAVRNTDNGVTYNYIPVEAFREAHRVRALIAPKAEG